MTEEAHDDPHVDALATAAQTTTVAASVTAALARLRQEKTGPTHPQGNVATDVETANVVHRVAPTSPPGRSSVSTTPALAARPHVPSSAPRRRR
jgi:hypothetical protein